MTLSDGFSATTWWRRKFVGSDNLLGEPLTNLSAARLAAVFQRIQRVVDQTARLDRSLSASSNAISNEMKILADVLQILADELAHVEGALGRIVKAETDVLEGVLADRISAAVVQEISTALASHFNAIESRFQRIEQRVDVLPVGMRPWWRRLWNVIASR